MKFTQILCKQHIGWHFKKLWAQQSALKVVNTGAEQILKENNIPVYKPQDILKEKREFEKVEIIGYKPKPIKFDETHPNWHDKAILTYKDNNVLLEGLTQAKIVTNTVELTDNHLPENIFKDDLKMEDVHEEVKKIILKSHVFDAEQQKLPKIKDPERPAWNFPRIYGITQDRVNKLLITRLIQLIESISDLDKVKEKNVIEESFFSFPFDKYDNTIQFQLKGDILITSSKPLKSLSQETGSNVPHPDIFPIKPTITLNEENIYEIENIYPINLNHKKCHPHSVFVFFNKENVKNIFEEVVTEQQIFGRSLLKSFTIAASYARSLYGNEVTQLDTPVTIQCIQTDGKFFHFGIFQLNSLDLNNENIKNIWYQTRLLPLFNECCYKLGKPILSEYNKDIIRYLYSLYNNE